MLLGRMFRIFQRYADIHVAFDLPGVSLVDETGARIGRAQQVSIRRNRLSLTGEVTARQIDMQVNRTRQSARAVMDDPDDPPLTFELDIPLETGPIDLCMHTETGLVRQQLRGVSAGQLRRARLKTALGFVWRLTMLLPQIYAWKWRGDLTAREAVKSRLGLVLRPKAAALPSQLWHEVEGTPKPGFGQATLIMPVFNAFDLLPEALDRVVRHSGDGWRLVLVEDCSTDDRVRPFLTTWAADPAWADRVTLLQNERNLGFIGSVNRAFEEARRWPDDPVVLLNSDAFVPEGWLPRLLAPLASPDVASVTPMSNDAEIFSVPVICQQSAVLPGVVDMIDRIAARLDPKGVTAETPTGVGFCMALSPRFLAQVPRFDTTFGRGYGEETDWCQKVRALGGRHLGTGTVFVEHRGGESFGSAAKQRLLEINQAEISRRYPAYDQEVQGFIAEDPLGPARLVLGVAWAGEQHSGSVPVYLAHALGGGADFYLDRRIETDIAAGGAAVVIRVGLLRRWQIEVHSRYGVTRGTTDDVGIVSDVISCLPRRRMIYSCGVGDSNPVTLPDILLDLAGTGEEAQPIEVLLHDYFPISPSYTLLGSDLRYHGAPRGQTSLAEDPAHRFQAPDGRQNSLEEWQAAWGRLLSAAEQITVFSAASRDILTEVYPQIRAAVRVVPHQLIQVPERLVSKRREDAPPVIGVLGHIGVQKGAAVLQDLSRSLARSGAARLVVIGNLAPEYQVPAPHVVHGAYEMRDLQGLVARYGISCWLIPSIWPETFSFTTHEALATGLPVFAFDLGAQGAAVAQSVAKGAPGGVLPLPKGQGDGVAESILAALARGDVMQAAEMVP